DDSGERRGQRDTPHTAAPHPDEGRVSHIPPNTPDGRRFRAHPHCTAPPEPGGSCSGHLVERTVAALGRGQPPALGGDRAALHTVRVVDDHVYVAVLGGVLGDLIHPGGAHPAPRFGDLPRHVFLNPDVVWRVVACRVAGDEYRGELVEGVF